MKLLSHVEFAHRAHYHQKLYEKLLEKNNLLDFSHLQKITLSLLEENSDILESCQKEIHYVMIDEFQDTNYLQFQIMSLICRAKKNLMVVGDDDQSIYKWRGAEVKNVLHFEDRYPEAKIVCLEQNYRSTGTILAAAEAVVSNNESRWGKKLWTKNETGEKIYCFNALNEHEEANFICNTIQNDYKKIAPKDRLAFIEKLLKYVIPTQGKEEINISSLTEEELDAMPDGLRGIYDAYEEMDEEARIKKAMRDWEWER